MSIDLSTPHARMAQHFMREVKGLNIAPHRVEPLEGSDCWYFYYRLPQGDLELEVYFNARKQDWDVSVTAFPMAR